MKKILLVALLGVFPSFYCFAESVQIPADRTIKTIHAYDTFIFIEFSPSFDANQGCTASDQNVKVAIDTSNDLGRNIYSAALSAAAAKKKVGFGITGCYSGRPKLYRIDVKF